MNKTPQCALGRVIESGINAEEVKRNGWRLQGIDIWHIGTDLAVPSFQIFLEFFP